MPATRSIAIHDLLTHQAGFPGAPGNSLTASRRREVLGSLSPDVTLAEYVARFATLPPDTQPGAEWRYGSATLVLGRVIEVISGKTLDVFLRERIFGPRGMSDTAFELPPEKVARLAAIYSRGTDERLTRNASPATSARLYSANGGLFSTAPDYLRFCQMLLNGGELEGRRLLGRKSIELMATEHVPRIPLPFLRGQAFGLGVAVQKEGGDAGLLGSPGTYGWSGAYNTYFRIDPKEQLVFVLMVQQRPANNLETQYGFQNVVMQALAD